MQKSASLSISMTPNELRLGLVYLLLSLVLIPGAIPRIVRLLVPDISAAAQNFTYFVFQFLCVCIIFRRFLWRSVKVMGQRPARLAGTVLVGLLAYFLMSWPLSVCLGLLAPDFSNVNDGSIANLASQNYSLMAFGTILLVPVTEEVLYRGVLFGCLSKSSTVAAGLISTLVFCFLHVSGYIGLFDPLVLLFCFFQYIPAGICLAWAYQRADSIFAPILMHAIINAIGIFSVR